MYNLKGEPWFVDRDLTWGLSLAWGKYLGVGGDYVCFLVIVVIFMRLEGAKKYGFKV